MRHHLGTIALSACLLALPVTASATEDKPEAPGGTGSESVIVNGQRAKRTGDVPGAVGSPNVFIGRPAIIECTEGTPILSPNVFVDNGRPKVLGCKK